MIQINLLPDVKTAYVKSQRTRNTVLVGSLIVSGVAIAIMLVLASVVYGAQKVQISSLNNSIKENSEELKSIEGLNKILTVQNQLKSIGALHADKPVTSRLFTFLPQLVPTDVQISNLNLKYEGDSLVFTGTAKDLLVVNKFVDTLKFTKYTTDQSTDEKPAFKTVVLSSFSRSDKNANYTISTKFDPAIFDSANKEVVLVVPKITSTRSQVEQPTQLFNQQATPQAEGEQ
jgi:Tfp pilus assembly protein PilN